MHRRDGGPDGPDQDHTPPVDRQSALGPDELRGSVERARDEAEAQRTRRRLREQGIVPVEPDPKIAVMLDAEEVVVTIRRSVGLDRRQPAPSGRGPCGDLYITNRRLFHLGRDQITYDLDRIREAMVVGDELLLMLDDGHGVAITVPDPRRLRVEIGAARAMARADRSA